MNGFKLLLILSLVSLNAFAQDFYDKAYNINIANTDIIAIDIEDYPEDTQKDILYEKWIKYNDAFYLMMFKMTPVGYKHCLDTVHEILDNNGISFDNDRNEESILIPDYCDGYDDYYCLPRVLKSGNAEVVITWFTKNYDHQIVLTCNDGIFSVALSPKPE